MHILPVTSISESISQVQYERSSTPRNISVKKTRLSPCNSIQKRLGNEDDSGIFQRKYRISFGMATIQLDTVGGGGGRIKYSGRQGLGRHTLHHIIVEGDNLSRVGSAAVRVHKACHLPTVPT